MSFYFLLQFRRMLRELRAFGVMPVLAFALGSSGFILASIAVFRQIPAHAVYIYPLGAIGICVLLANKERNDFLVSTFSKRRVLTVRGIENAIAAMPFAIFLVVKHQFVISAATILFCPGLALFRQQRTIRFYIPSPFSGRPYEFTTGFRRNYILLLFLYVISGIALKSHNYNLGVVLVLAMSLTASTFYSHLDPVYYVWIFAFSGKQFLWEKLKTSLKYGFILLSPIFLPLVFIYPGYIALSLLIVVIGMLIISLAVLAAYVNFPSKMTIYQQVKFYLGIFFPPALLVMIPDFYLRASERLKVYLKC